MFLLGNFSNAADFPLYLRVCKFVTFVKRLKKASAKIFYFIYGFTLNIFYTKSLAIS